MGQCCSKAQYELIRRFDDDAWHNWDGHFARQFYDIDRTLGKGAFSEVVAATQRNTGRRVALKVVFLDNPRLTEDHAAVLRDEVAIIESLRHPNVVTFDCVMEDSVRRQVVIAEEILLGGTLTEELGAAAANNDDRLLAHVFRQLLSALAHMHGAGIVHRDLKPENVMFRAQAGEWAEAGAVPVIIDFGMSTRVQPGGAPVVGLLGSPGFVAPEVIKGEPHTVALDMFALGVILYICIAGRRPMSPKQANTLAYAHYEAWEYPNMPADDLWQSANARVRSLVLQMLERDPAKRITAAQALQHPWVTADMRTPRPLSVRDDAAAVAVERRMKLTAERKQATVEEMLRYMILALRERQRAHSGDKLTPPRPRDRTPALRRHPSGTAHPILTSVSAPQAGSATSFFQWMQQHLDDDGATPTPADATGAAAAAADANTAAAAERPLLRDVRCRSDMTHAGAAASNSATAAAARLAGSKVSAGAPVSAASPADLLVESHLQRHLSLVRRCSSGSVHRVGHGGSRDDGAAAPVSPPHSGTPAQDLLVPASSAVGDSVPTRTDVQSPPATLPVTGRALRTSVTAEHAEHAAHAVSRAGEDQASTSNSSDAAAAEQAATAHWARVQFADGAGSTEDQKQGSIWGGVEASVVDSFPLYNQGKGARLYSVVLAATRRARNQQCTGEPDTPPLATRTSSALGEPSLGDSVSLEEIAAVAQVEWGLRRWRQLAKRVPPAAPRSEAGRSAVAVADTLPEDVKQAREIAELALRFRGVGV